MTKGVGIKRQTMMMTTERKEKARDKEAIAIVRRKKSSNTCFA